MKITLEELHAKTQTLSRFVNRSQLTTMVQGVAGEEGLYFLDKINEYVERFENMPKTYETDGQGDEAIVYLHFFKGSADWYITERDMEEEQHQAFGLADVLDAELGYISLVELASVGAELDIHWTPKKLGTVKAAIA